jgi:hypothetical protein
MKRKFLSAINEISKDGSLLIKREYCWQFGLVTCEEIILLVNSANIVGEQILFCQQKNPHWQTVRTLLVISEYVTGEESKFC